MQTVIENRREIRFVFATFMLMILLGFAYMIFHLYQVRQINDMTTRQFERTLAVSNAVLGVQADIAAVHNHMKSIFSPDFRDELEMHVHTITLLERDVSEKLAAITADISDTDGSKLASKVATLFSDCKPMRDHVITLARNRQYREAIAYAKNRGERQVAALEASLAELYDYTNTRARYFKEQSDTLFNKWAAADLLLSSAMFLAFIYITYSTLRRVKRHLDRNTRLNHVLSVIREVNELIVRERSPQALIQSCCTILTTDAVYANVWIVLFDSEGEVSRLAGSDRSADFQAFKAQVDSGWTPVCVNKSVLTDRPYCSLDETEASCEECPLRERYDRHHALHIALRHNDRIYGYLSLSFDKQQIAPSDELSLLNEVAGDIAYALHNLETVATLRRSEQRYRALFESNRAVELIIDPENGAIIDCNEKAANYYGYSRERLMAMKISDINIQHAEDIAREMETAAQQQRDVFYFKHRLADGTIRDVEVYSGPIEFDRRKLLYSIIFDITESKRQEETILYLKELYDNVIDSVDNLIFVKDTDYTYLACNRAFEEFIGRPKSEIIGKTDYELMAKESADFFRNYDETMMAERRSKSNYEWVKYPDGRDVYLLTSKSPLFNSEGTLLGLVGNSVDLTEQQRLYEQLEEAQEIAHTGSWEYDIVNDSLKATEEIYKIFALNDHSAVLTFDTFLTRYHPDDVEKVEQAYQSSLTNKGVTVISNRMINHDGEIRYLEHRWRTVFKDGKPVKTVGTTQDVTAQKETEQALKRSQKQFEIAEKIGHVGSWEYNIKTQRYSGSAETKRIFGIPQDINAMTQEELDTAIPDRELVRRALDDLLAQRSIYDIEYEITPLDGSGPKIVHSIGELEYDAHGKPQKVVGFLQDITAQVEAEKALKLSNDKFEKAFNTTPNMILITEMESGRIYEVNQTFEKVLGFTRDEVIGKTSINLGMWENTEDRDRSLNRLRQAGELGSIIHPFKAKDGHTVLTEVFVSIVTINEKAYIMVVADDITEERALEIENSKFIQVLDQSVNELHVFNIDNFHYTYINKAGLMALGYTKEELETLTPIDMTEAVHSVEDLERISRSLQQTKREQVIETKHRRKDGTTYPVEAHLQIIEVDSVKQVVVTAIDITERLQNETALKASELRFHSIFSQTFQFLGIIGLDGTIIAVNNTALNFIGKKESEVIGKPFWRTTWWRHSLELRKWLKESIAKVLEGNVIQREVTHKAQDGEIHYFDFSLKPIVDEQGNIQYLVAESRDITERKEAEQTLLESHRQLSALMNNLPGMAYSCRNDRQWSMEFLSEGCLTLTGYPASDIIQNRRISYADLIHPDDYEKVWNKVQSKLKNGGHFELDYRIITAQGKTKWVWEHGIGIYGIKGDILSIEGVILDNDARKKAEQTLVEQEKLILAQSRHAAMGEMIGMIAHQWRQPVTGIAMNANNMLLDIALGDLDLEKAEKYSYDVLEQTRHLSKTIDDFRNFFKPDKAVSKVTMREILEETYTIVKDSLNNNHIKLTTNYASESEIKAYARELMQVFVNIITNAKDAITTDKSIQGLIQIKVYDDNGYVVTKVCDNGTGIDEAIINRIFDPYFTTKDEQSGTGIGLYMSKMIIEEHLHGLLEVSNTDNGVCFTVKLPKYRKGMEIF